MTVNSDVVILHAGRAHTKSGCYEGKAVYGCREIDPKKDKIGNAKFEGKICFCKTELCNGEFIEISFYHATFRKNRTFSTITALH